MNSRRTSLYKLIFKYIKVETGAEPGIFMSDYENSMRKAAKEVWPRIETPGCSFHYRQAIRRNYNTKVFPKPLKQTPKAAEHKMVIRMIMNLQFLPPLQIIPAAIHIKQYQRQHDLRRDFKSFNKYFIRYWIRSITAQNFSMFGRVHRTNNICESFNSRLNSLSAKHPNIYALLHRMVLMTVEGNQKRLDNYENKSRMTVNLNVAWDALEAGQLATEDFIKLNFNNPNMRIH